MNTKAASILLFIFLSMNSHAQDDSNNSGTPTSINEGCKWPGLATSDPDFVPTCKVFLNDCPDVVLPSACYILGKSIPYSSTSDVPDIPPPDASDSSSKPSATATPPKPTPQCLSDAATATNTCSADPSSSNATPDNSGGSLCGSATTTSSQQQAAITEFKTQCQTAINTCNTSCEVGGDFKSNCSPAATNLAAYTAQAQQVVSSMGQSVSACAQVESALSQVTGAVSSALSPSAQALACAGNSAAPGCPNYNPNANTTPAYVPPVACAGGTAGSAFCANLGNQGTDTAAGSGISPTTPSGVGAGGGGASNISAGGLADMLASPVQSTTPSPSTSANQGLGVPPGGGSGFGGAGLGGNPSASAAAAKKPRAPTASLAREVPKLYGGLLTPSDGAGGSIKGSSQSTATGIVSTKPVLGQAYIDRPDFSKFTPNMKYNPPRGPASSSGSVNDIAPRNTDIFVNLSHGYQSQINQGNLLSE